MSYVPYNKKLKHRASHLRNNSTRGETLLWQKLKHRQQGYDFNRQKPLLNYIVDFYCIKLKLAIEIDGSSHDEAKFEYDERRQRELEREGITFLRFTEYEARNSLYEVVQTIELKIMELEQQHP